MLSEKSAFFSNLPYAIYVEANGDPTGTCCLFIPGGYHTGFCYTKTPDGRDGWGKIAANYGYHSLITDVPGTGRSGGVPFEKINSQFIVDAYVDLINKIDQKVIIFVHSLSGSIGFKIAETIPNKVSHLVAVEPSMFGNIQEVLIPKTETDEMVCVNFHGLEFKLDMTKAAPASQQVIDRFTTKNDSTKLLFPKYSEQHLDQYAASLQNQHPRLLYELFNIRESKLKIENFGSLKCIQFLVLTSPDDPLHKEDDIKIVTKLREEGCNVEHWNKGAHGTEGNTHMMMIEKNNENIFIEINKWILNNK